MIKIQSIANGSSTSILMPVYNEKMALRVLIADWVTSAWIAVLLAGDQTSGERAMVFIYPLLYSSVVLAVFESDRRQHLMTLCFLIVFAAGAIVSRTGCSDSDACVYVQ